jgi:uncharacterized metal-binding protein YceD (DUF177 family)
MMNGEKRKGKEKAYLEIKLSELEQGPIRIDCAIPVEWLQKRMSFCEYSAEPKAANAKLVVQPTGGKGVLIRGTLDARIETRCGTCLKDILFDIAPEISTYLVPKNEALKEMNEIELTPEDLDREYFEGDSIILDEIIGDAVMLEMPMNPKCAEGCEGLKAFSSGTDETQAIDPRLAPLMGIQLKKEN